MRDLKIKPGMDTPKAKLKNPAPKDADSLLKQHMDKRQREKEPESHDPVRYATDRVEKNMRRGASGAADASRRMIKHYQEQKRQGRNSASESRTAAETLETTNRVTPAGRNLPDTPQSHAARNEVGNQTVPPQNCGGPKSVDAAPQERGRQKAAQDVKAIGGTLPRKEQQSGTLYLHRPTVEVQRPLRIKAIRAHRSRAVLPQRADRS